VLIIGAAVCLFTQKMHKLAKDSENQVKDSKKMDKIRAKVMPVDK